MNKLLRTKLPQARYALKLKRNYKLKTFREKDIKVLEICGGIAPISRENINVDILDDPMVDVIAELHEKLPFPDENIDKIISIATLEHFSLPDMRKVLNEFRRILKSGAVLEIGVPSLEKIFNYYKEFGLDDVCLRHLHGAQKDEYDIHLCVMDFAKMKKELESLNYSGVLELEYDYPVQDKRFFMKVRAYKK